MSTDTIDLDQLPIACDPNAVPPEQQEYLVKEIVPKLYGAVQEIKELPNGWAWHLPSTPEILMLVAEDLNMERLCCPFFNFNMEVDGQTSSLWLSLSGGEGVKPFIVAELGGMLSDEIAAAANFR